MLLTDCDLENVPALHSFANSKVILTPAVSFIIEKASCLVTNIVNTRGGGGIWGYAPPEIFDFNSSQMPRNAFKINQRNPKIQTFGT